MHRSSIPHVLLPVPRRLTRADEMCAETGMSSWERVVLPDHFLAVADFEGRDSPRRRAPFRHVPGSPTRLALRVRAARCART